jgi:uncharacterized protein YoxC
MDWKAWAIAATTAGTVAISGLTFTGTIDLDSIKNKAFGWAANVTTSVDSTKAMLDKFNLFKTDVQAQINAKIAKINELNAAIADLNTKVGNGEASLDEANTEIARLNEEIEQANTEIANLKAQMEAEDANVSAQMDEMKTTEDMDTTLALDTQNADVAPTTGGTTSEATTEPTISTADSIEADLIAAYPALAADLQVTVTETTVTLSSNRISEQGIGAYESIIETGLNKEVTAFSSSGDYVYTIN